MSSSSFSSSSSPLALAFFPNKEEPAPANLKSSLAVLKPFPSVARDLKSKAAVDLFPDPNMEPVLESGWLGASSVLTAAAAPPNKELELVAEPPKIELLDGVPVPKAKVGLLLDAASPDNGANMLLVD